MSPDKEKGLTVRELEQSILESGPNVTTTDIPIRDDVRRTVAAALTKALAAKNRPKVA